MDPTVEALFDSTSEDERIAHLRNMGATNVDPPLRRSSHLKAKRTGRVYPWSEILALQTTLMVNCDASGNTDPAAWEPTVVDADTVAEEQLALIRREESRALMRKEEAERQKRDALRAAGVPTDPMRPQPTVYPEGVVEYADLDKLLQMLGDAEA